MFKNLRFSNSITKKSVIFLVVLSSLSSCRNKAILEGAVREIIKTPYTAETTMKKYNIKMCNQKEDSISIFWKTEFLKIQNKCLVKKQIPFYDEKDGENMLVKVSQAFDKKGDLEFYFKKDNSAWCLAGIGYQLQTDIKFD